MRFSAFFVWGAEGLLRGTSAFPLDSGVGEAHDVDFYNAKLSFEEQQTLGQECANS
jgi:hypothetical protein